MPFGGGIGNKYGIKLKDAALRQRAFKSYCAWIALGNSKNSFTFEEGKFKCCWATMCSYIEKNPHEFDIEQTQYAKSKGYSHWESIVNDSAKGKNKHANTASLQMKMRNQFGWDKETKSKEKFDTEKLEAIANFFSCITTSPPKSPETKQEESSNHND